MSTVTIHKCERLECNNPVYSCPGRLSRYCSRSCAGIGKHPSTTTRQKMSDSHMKNKTNWKGDNVKYVSIHRRVSAVLGLPDICEHCGKHSSTTVRLYWSSKDHVYRMPIVVSEWQRLCSSCHHIYDNKLRKTNTIICK